MKEKREQEMILVLDNIRSAENVGSLFRTADAAGVKEVYLCGVTPDPIDRFGRIVAKIAKAALGAEKNISWKHFSSTRTCINNLKKKGFEIVALEQAKNAIAFTRYKPKGKLALILGNEVDGITEPLLSLADVVIEIPMRGEKESLNVSVAGGIALFEILKD